MKATGLTLQQYKRGMAELETRELLIRNQGFSKVIPDGKAYLHVRLTELAESNLYNLNSDKHATREGSKHATRCEGSKHATRVASKHATPYTDKLPSITYSNKKKGKISVSEKTPEPSFSKNEIHGEKEEGKSDAINCIKSSSDISSNFSYDSNFSSDSGISKISSDLSHVSSGSSIPTSYVRTPLPLVVSPVLAVPENPPVGASEPVPAIPLANTLVQPLPEASQPITEAIMPPVHSPSVSEFLDQFKDKQLPPIKGDGPKALADVWNRVCVKYGYPATSFTGKDFGQMKNLMAKTPGKTAKIIRAVVADWTSFAKGAASDVGLFTHPYKPELGFVLKYAHLAQEFLLTNTPYSSMNNVTNQSSGAGTTSEQVVMGDKAPEGMGAWEVIQWKKAKKAGITLDAYLLKLKEWSKPFSEMIKEAPEGLSVGEALKWLADKNSKGV